MRCFIIAFLFYISSSICLAQQVQLATVYDGEDVSNYLVSEKLDGIRAIWDGQRLTTRSGQPIIAPTWFVDDWPNVWFDGELWAGREGFNTVQKTVLDRIPNDTQWRTIRYMVFDAPDNVQTFADRYEVYLNIVNTAQSKYLKPVLQQHISSSDELYQLLDKTVNQGGEGLILHRKDALFKDGRSDALLKLKPFQDAEAKVVGYVPGRGKYADKMGAVVVELASGRRFKIGSGFSDFDRVSPPKVGEYVTFRYQGLTSTGLPRFASFIRIRTGPFEFRDPD